MTDQTTAGAAVADIKNDADALIAKIDQRHREHGEFSTLLSNAKSAIVSAIQYVEAHFRALEDQLDGDVAGDTKDPAAAPETTTGAVADQAPAAADPALAAAPASTDAPAAAPAEAPAAAST